jgi:hypothetical protein
LFWLTRWREKHISNGLFYKLATTILPFGAVRFQTFGYSRGVIFARALVGRAAIYYPCPVGENPSAFVLPPIKSFLFKNLL